MTLALQPFLSAFDPSDLPGGSIDPLGFDRGYNLLADKILPGLTNVASRPRYFSVLCGAIRLADEGVSGDRETLRQESQRRHLAILRFERFWTLACLLASRKDAELDVRGIRGFRYVEAATKRLEEAGDTSSSASFRLLSRQATHGMIGIYGNVAEGLGFIKRERMSLDPELGRRLGEAFVLDTEIPGPVRSAVLEDGATVGVTTLARWGTQAHIDANPSPMESQVFAEALARDPTRQRMTELLRRHPRTEGETELQRLNRILGVLSSGDHDHDLREALRMIVAFEDGFRAALLVLTRVLWFCQEEQPFTFELDRAVADPAILHALSVLRSASERLETAVAEATTVAAREDLSRLREIRDFLRNGAASANGAELVEAVIERHGAVQGSKLDGGRPKMPWLVAEQGKVKPTLSSAMRINGEPRDTDDVAAHPYRTPSADALCNAGRAS